MTGPQLVRPSLFCRRVNPTGSVATEASSAIRNGHRYSFHSLTRVIVAKATIVGIDSGSTTLVSRRK